MVSLKMSLITMGHCCGTQKECEGTINGHLYTSRHARLQAPCCLELAAHLSFLSGSLLLPEVWAGTMTGLYPPAFFHNT